MIFVRQNPLKIILNCYHWVEHLNCYSSNSFPLEKLVLSKLLSEEGILW